MGRAGRDMGGNGMGGLDKERSYYMDKVQGLDDNYSARSQNKQQQ